MSKIIKITIFAKKRNLESEQYKENTPGMCMCVHISMDLETERGGHSRQEEHAQQFKHKHSFYRSDQYFSAV